MKFAYELLSADGKLERGSLEAPNEGEARRTLQRQGQTLLSLEEHVAVSGRRRISAEEQLLAFSELATLLHSGLGIAEAVASIAAARKDDALGELLERLGRAISQGKPFAEALRLSGAALPEYVFQLAQAGEMTGRLAQSLEEALAQYAYERDFASELRNALIYPVVLVVSGLLAVLLMFTLVVPRFASLLRDPDTLPWLAWAVLSGGSFLSENLLTVLALATALVLAVVYAMRRPGAREALFDRLASLPVLGPWLLEAETASWASLMAALLGQGVPMLDALELANRGMRLARRRSRLQAAARAVKAGLALSSALEEHGAFNATAYNLLRTGERAGRLPEMLRALATLYTKSGRNRLKRVLLLVEPVAILLIGAGIGTIVIGIVLAITSVSDIPI